MIKKWVIEDREKCLPELSPVVKDGDSPILGRLAGGPFTSWSAMFTSDFQTKSANCSLLSNSVIHDLKKCAQKSKKVPLSSTVPIFAGSIYEAIIRDLRLACSFSMSSDKADEGWFFSLPNVVHHSTQLIQDFTIVELRELTTSLPKGFSSKTFKLRKISH